MRPGLVRIAALGLACWLAAGSSGCSSDVQAGQAERAPVIVASHSAMPEPQAPFDETPITPRETVGASIRD